MSPRPYAWSNFFHTLGINIVKGKKIIQKKMKKYIVPIVETMHLRTEHAVLTASEIPMGGETGHFDTRAQNDWEDE